jgi:hypothetical protein
MSTHSVLDYFKKRTTPIEPKDKMIHDTEKRVMPRDKEHIEDHTETDWAANREMNVSGSAKRNPAFALACRRHLWEPVSQSTTSVLHAVIHERWQASLRDHGVSLFVNTVDPEDRYNRALERWK